MAGVERRAGGERGGAAGEAMAEKGLPNGVRHCCVKLIVCELVPKSSNLAPTFLFFLPIWALFSSVLVLVGSTWFLSFSFFPTL